MTRIGTFYGTGGPVDISIEGGVVVIRPAYARRMNRIEKAWRFLRQCARWRRVQKYGSNA